MRGTSEAAEEDAVLVGDKAGTFDRFLLSPLVVVSVLVLGARECDVLISVSPTVLDRPRTVGGGGETDTVGRVDCRGDRGSSNSTGGDWGGLGTEVGGADCEVAFTAIAVIEMGDGFSLRPRMVLGAVEDGEGASSLMAGKACSANAVSSWAVANDFAE